MMSEKRFSYEYSENSAMIRIIDRKKEEPNGWSMCNVVYTVKRLNEQQSTISQLEEENEQLKNELRKEKSLREYSDSMIDVDLIVNIRFSNGEWKADVSVIDDE